MSVASAERGEEGIIGEARLEGVDETGGVAGESHGCPLGRREKKQRLYKGAKGQICARAGVRRGCWRGVRGWGDGR